MLKRKAKRILAGLCVALMLTQSIGESALVAAAAENTVEAPAEESAIEDLGGADGTVTSGDVTEADGEKADEAEAETDTEEAEEAETDETFTDEVDATESVDAETDEETGEGILEDEVTAFDEDGTEAGGETAEEWTPLPSLKGKVSNMTGVVLTNGGEEVGKIDSDGVFTAKASVGVYEGMFAKWLDVKELYFEEDSGVKLISNNAFKECTNLTKIDLSNCASLTVIGEYAFSGCTSLQTIKFHDNLQIIQKQCFANCKAMQSVTLTKGLTEIGESAFSGCEALAEVTLETSNVSAKTKIFQGCKISKINFELKKEKEDASGNNIIVPANLFHTAGFDSTANIVIPANIQEIGEYAFNGATNLTQVTFENSDQNPSALTTIGKYAFYNTALTEVTFPEIVLQTIGDSAFEGCKGLSKLTLPSSLTALNSRAFRNCTQISSLTIPNANAAVGDYVFEGCESLTEVELPEGLTSTGKGEFKSCTSLMNVKLPSTLEIISDETFMKCRLLRNITLPDTVTTLGKQAFRECAYLEKIEYSPILKVINTEAFYDCSSLTSNVFPETLEEIGASAFYNCQSFIDLTIPANVTAIGKEAFARCYGINVLTIEGNNLTKCGTAIFNSCLLKEVRFPEGITKIPDMLFSQATFAATCVMTIPNTVTEVGNSAFCGTQVSPVNLTTVVFEPGTQLEIIGPAAFMYCTAIESFTIPETTETIGTNAFNKCQKLESIVIPENVTSIGSGAFFGCSNLTEITYNAIDATTNMKSKPNDAQCIFGGCNVKTIRIGQNVRTFPAYLFYGAQFSTNTTEGEEEMITINVPASVETIGAYALPNIANLQHVVFADGSKLTEIGENAFQKCSNMESCNLPDSVTAIGNFAFSGCTKLGSDKTKPFKIPSSLVTLGSSAFADCPSLTEVVIPGGVAKISDMAFQNDIGLTSALLQGGSLTEIGVSAFEGCTSLKEISIPNGVKTIGKFAFRNCIALTKVVIPASVEKIGDNAFEGCSNVQFLVVPGSYAEQWLEDNNFRSGALQTITYVLDGGTNAPQNPAGYEPGDTFTFAPATRKGYTFVGWYLDEKFTNEITGVEGQKENLTIYAKWEIEVYTITYELNGGTNASGNPATYTIEDEIKLEDATKDSAVFEGWYTDLSNSKSKVTGIKKGESGDKTFYAKWSGSATLEPTASIKSGSTVKAGTKLLLTSLTPGAYIYYTLDGSNPSEQSTLYVDGIIINATVTVRAIAVKPGADPSEIVEFTYNVIDETKDWGDIAPEDRTTFTDATGVPEGIWVAGVEDGVVYTGKKITFDLRVYDNKTLLKEKTDYTVKYSNNQKAAEKNIGKKAPTVTVTAKGNYKGKVVIYFTIKGKDIGGDEFSAEDLYAPVTGKLQKPAPVLYCGRTKLKIKKDYQIDSVSAGGYMVANTYEVKLKGVGNYTGERIIQFTLANGIALTKAKITGLTAQTYTGEEIKPNFTVTVGSTPLVEGTHYYVKYSNNVDAGTATATVIGMGDYCGSKKATFKINPIAKMNKVQIALDKATVDYTGEAYEIGKGINVTASYNGQPLAEGKDFTCSYKSNVNAGKATVTFTGIGGYSGTAKKTFKIAGANISMLDVKFLDDEGNAKEDISYAFVQGGVKPEVRISYGDQILKAGTDYTASYKDNAAARGTGTIIIKGKKNFTGTITKTFAITQQNLEELSVFATDVVWKNEAGIVETSQVTVKDVNGKALVTGTDYKVVFVYENDTRLSDGKVKKANTTVGKTDIVPAETVIRVKISGAGNYTGNTFTLMRVCQKSISSAKVKVNQQIYTGFEVQPGKDQMTVTLGRATLGTGDYEIVGYENNIKKGTAKVTIRGVGNYGGSKTATFKIVQKPFDLKLTLFNFLF